MPASGESSPALEAAPDAYLDLLTANPGDPLQINTLASMLPANGIGTEGIRRLRIWLKRLSRQLAAGDRALVERLDKEIREAETRGDGR